MENSKPIVTKKYNKRKYDSLDDKWVNFFESYKSKTEVNNITKLLSGIIIRPTKKVKFAD